MPAMARNAGAGAAAAYAVESEDVEEKRVTRRIQLRDDIEADPFLRAFNRETGLLGVFETRAEKAGSAMADGSRKVTSIFVRERDPLTSARSVAELTQGERDAFRATFDEMDVDGSGQIDAEELVAALALIDKPASAAEAQAMIDEVDADGDGVADVRQITSEQLATRKVLLTLRAVDPPKVAEAFGGVVAGGAAVLAAVRVRFAAAVALGHSVAQHAARPLAALLSPALTHALPLEYRKWVPVLVGGAAKLLAITCVWLVAAAQAAVQSALRGGMLASRSALRMLAAADRLPAPLLGAGGTWDEDASAVDEACGWALAAVGCYFQLAHGFAVPFPLSVCALPFDLAEFALRWLVVAAGDGASPLDATLADVPAS